eukprot:7815260-Prorocentrum_lima.AAC.1
MTSSLVGSEMCIRDRRYLSRGRSLLCGSCSSVTSLWCFAYCDGVCLVRFTEAWGAPIVYGV